MLHPQIAAINPHLIIFDKDGTLIDFHAMWGGWITGLAQRLEAAANRPLAAHLFRAVAYDAVTGRIDPAGHLALTPVAGIRAVISEALQAAGLSPDFAEATLQANWLLPDAITLAQPITDLAELFNSLQKLGLKIAIATSDDRAPTESMLIKLGVIHLVDALICADDGLPLKPAPDMVLAVGRRLNVSPVKSVMVGDNTVDLQMGRAAGVGLAVGVLSGLASAEALSQYADILLPSVADLIEMQN
jgi:HAD superfamily hydrolase (TIGR01549 family)